MNSKIRALASVGLLAAVITMAAPCAFADVVKFTCDGDNNLGSCSNDPFDGVVTASPVAFPGPTLDVSWYSQTIDVTLPSTWKDSDNYDYLISNGGIFIANVTQGGPEADEFGWNTNLANGDGISEFGTLAFNPIIPPPPGVPEPATLALLGVGLAGMGFMRRRKAA